MNRYEKGQVLPLGLVLVVFSVVGALMLFNTGQVASDKMRLANSADAAAYSGALWQARALNYQAYANRAMVANQVAIGQAVSLQSWMTYAAMTSENLATALKPIPVLNLAFGSIDSLVKTADRVVSAGAKTMLRLTDAATLALSVSQSAMHGATLYNTAEIISVVASETDNRFTTNSAYGLANKALNVTQWSAFNTQYTKRDTDAMKERQQLIMASRDKFTRSRNWELWRKWIVTGPVRRVGLWRQGTTRLEAVKRSSGMEWEWVAKETLSIQHRKKRLFGDDRLRENAVAWASAFTNSRGSRRQIKSQSCSNLGFMPCERYTRDNHKAEGRADRGSPSLAGTRTLKPMTGYGGVRSFWVLSDAARTADDARLTVRVEVSLPLQEIRDSNAIMNADRLSAPVVVAGNTLSSLSTADVSYRRPRHHLLTPSRREKANSYNPYWTAQLAPVSHAERIAAVAVRSGGTSPTVRADTGSPMTQAGGSSASRRSGDSDPIARVRGATGGTVANTVASNIGNSKGGTNGARVLARYAKSHRATGEQ